ncbi:MAG: sulfatase-like hydrolase/transferase [Verrucomicrobiota bacterium]|nr:sulfatase-like hydrolase/transferase [Verrucomicrobiota bacterium]
MNPSPRLRVSPLRVFRAPLRVFAVCLFASIAGSAAETPKPAKANIVLIVADDMGYGDASCYWKTDVRTPVLDAIARNGIRFTQFRVTPLCAPTRASIMTGLYSVETGMWRGPGGDAGKAEEAADSASRARRLKSDLQLLPQYLKAAGYVTGMFGKWHLGSEPGNVPNARGFDEFVGFLGGAHPYWLGRNSRILRNGKPFPAEGHTTDLFAGHAIEFIKSNKARPFFCYVPFNAVHGPLRNASRDADSARPEWLAIYEKAGVAQPRRDYCAVLSHADQRVGDILETLRALGLEANTLVIFVSDNGGILHTYPSNNGPLRGGKGMTYEGGVRVPALMQWPGVIPAGSVSDASATHFDLFSTILEAAGISVPAKNGSYPVRGVSLLPLLRAGGKAELPDRYLFWDLYGKVGALHGPWKMVGEISNHRGRFDRAVADAEKATFELYNLAEDLGETSNVAAKFPEIYGDLKARHLEWLRQFAK